MPSHRRPRLLRWGVLALAVVLIAGAAVVAFRWWRDEQRSDLEKAVAMAPRDGEQLSWTDWSGVRDELGLDLGDDPDDDEIADLLDRGFEADLTQTTALGDSAAEMQESLGFSPATIDWELFSQSQEGAVVMSHLPESTDLDEIKDTLVSTGYVEPDDDTGVWVGGNDLLAQLGGITPELTFLVVDEDRRMILSSDEEAYLAAVAEDLGDEDGPDGLGDVVAALDDPLAAAVYTGDHACAKLAMSQADEVDQDQANALIQRAGEVNPMTGFAIGLRPGGDVRVAMEFESDAQARTNADTRAELASGPAPGEGGDYSDLFDLGTVEADGRVVTMELEPVPETYVFSALKDGPVLFATC